MNTKNESLLSNISSTGKTVQGIRQDGEVNTVLFSEIVDIKHEEQFIINKRLMILEVLKFKGCFNAELLAPIPKIRKGWLTLIQFENEDLLCQWLSSDEYAQAFSLIKPYIKRSKKQFLSDFNRQVSHLITTTVAPERQEEWLIWHNKIYNEMIACSGFIGSDIKPSNIKRKGDNVTWIVNFQFENNEKLLNWLNSPQRAKLMREGARLFQASTVTTLASGFGSWFDLKKEEGITLPGWKMALTVEMALYPLLLGQAFLTPFINQWFVLPIALLINSFYGCFLMQYFLVPKVQKLMNFWLVPQRKRDITINILGFLLSLVYLVILTCLSLLII